MDVVTVAFIDDKKLLVVKPRSSIKSNKYTLIGGKVKETEDLITAIIRETKEELNVDIKEDEIKLILEFEETSASDSSKKINMHMFVTNKKINDMPYIADEILDYKWIDIDDFDVELSDSISKHLLPYLRCCS